MNLMQTAMALIGTIWRFAQAQRHAVAGRRRYRACRSVRALLPHNALRVADAIVVIPLDFLRIPLIALVG